MRWLLRLSVPLLFLAGLFFIPTMSQAAETDTCSFFCKKIGVEEQVGPMTELLNRCDADKGSASCVQICVTTCFEKNLACDRPTALCTKPPYPGCAGKADASDVDQVARKENVQPDQFSCQKVDLNNPNQVLRCVQNGCPDQSNDVLCCIPQTGGLSGTKESSSSSAAGGGVSSGILQLPGCTEDGSCELDDIVRMGVTVANFFLGLSGALFLGIFVYAGLLYLLSGGDSAWAKKGKEMMKHAAIAMIIIFGAGAIVRFVYISFTRQTPGPTACEKTPGYSCQVLSGDKAEIEQRGCKASKQGGSSLCSGTNVYCCPIDPPEKPPENPPKKS